MSALASIPPLEFAKLWGELVEAYHGVNGYGGNVAEIYAYRLMPYSPLVALNGYSAVKDGPAVIRSEDRAARALVELCEIFAQDYDALIAISYGDGFCTLREWLRFAPRFNHRVHIRVERAP